MERCHVEPRLWIALLTLLLACKADADHAANQAASDAAVDAHTAAQDAALLPSGADDASSADAHSPTPDAAAPTQHADASIDHDDDGAPTHPVATTCQVTSSPAPAASWVNATGNLAGLTSECGNLTLLAADPCSKRVIAGVAHAGLWARDDGTAWAQLAGSANIVHRPSSIVFDPEHPEVFYESGIYGNVNDGVYRTSDRGVTFTQLGTIGHNDLVSVDFSDPARKTLLAGAHETKRKLYRSTDGGASWTDIGMNLPADSHFSSAPLVLDARHFLLGVCGWGDGVCGVLRSSDAGATWSTSSHESPSGRPLWASDGHLLWTTIWDSGVITSTDLGKSWSSKQSGPHSGFPVELPDGRIAAVGGDHILLSSDGGTSWMPVGEPLPYAAAGVTYSVATKTFYIWHNDCKGVVLPDAVMSAGFDYESQ